MLREPVDQEVCCESVSPRNDKNTHNTSTIWLLKQNLKKDNTNRHVNMMGKKYLRELAID